MMKACLTKIHSRLARQGDRAVNTLQQDIGNTHKLPASLVLKLNHDINRLFLKYRNDRPNVLPWFWKTKDTLYQMYLQNERQKGRVMSLGDVSKLIPRTSALKVSMDERRQLK
jgi:hypothetical protein